MTAGRNIKVAVTTIYDASSVDRWPRVGTWMSQSLADQGLQLAHLGPLTIRRPWITAPKKAVYNHLLRRDELPRYYPGRDRWVVKDLCAQVDRKLAAIGADVIFSAESPWSQPIAYVESKLPILIWTDSTFAGVIGFNPAYDDLSRSTRRDGTANEARALARASIVVFSSHWAADRAREIYGIPEEKLRVVSYGPASEISHTGDDVCDFIGRRPSDRCQLLFLATTWQRKGGDVAVEVARRLNDAGLPTKLVVAGCTPPGDVAAIPWVDAVGFVDKSPEGNRLFKSLMSESHFFVLPTLADCTPLVFSEAAAYGLPCLSTDVGGVKTVIADDVNGKCFDLDSDPGEWSDYITKHLSNGTYAELAASSWREYVSRLNWDVAGREVAQMLRGLVVSR